MMDEALVQMDAYNYKQTPMNTLLALQALCPCNGWNWAGMGVPRTRNLGLFCGGAAQCPLLHEILLESTHFYSYTADTAQGCFTKINIDRKRGWIAPAQDDCFSKRASYSCPAGVLSPAYRAVSTWTTLLAALATALSAHSQ
jgi:hypothetical protein